MMARSREQARYFNPRSSCEERLGAAHVIPLWEGISIHAPHARSDLVLPVS